MLQRRCAILLSVKIMPDAGSHRGPAWQQPQPFQAQTASTMCSPTGDVDLSAIPSTIPGVSREELAEKLKAMQNIHQQKLSRQHEINFPRQIDTMRRAMPPAQFREFLESVEKKEAESLAEQEKMANMTPMQLFRYQQKKKRRENIAQWLNVFWLAFMVVSSTSLLLYFLIYFFH